MLRRFLVVLILLVLCAGAALAADETYSSGYVAVPKGAGPFPAVVVIHEWWGLHPWVKGQADRLAAQGYMALAIDLYHGKLAKDADEAHELSRGLPRDRAMRDLRAAVDYLAKRDDVRKDRIGCIGWCMGGGYAIELALADPRMVACVVAYGHVPSEGLKTLNGPVLGRALKK